MDGGRCTIVGDSLKDYGVDGSGGRVHDLLGTRCDPYGMYSHQFFISRFKGHRRVE